MGRPVIIRRRRLPDELERPLLAFEELMALLERARATLTESVPGTRVPGRPLGETLFVFERDLRRVREQMDGWRTPEVDEVWAACSAGLDEALAAAARVREDGSAPEGYEALVGLIGDLLAPLDVFRDAAERFGKLRA